VKTNHEFQSVFKNLKEQNTNVGCTDLLKARIWGGGTLYVGVVV
jgi:hypothetical protein